MIIFFLDSKDMKSDEISYIVHTKHHSNESSHDTAPQLVLRMTSHCIYSNLHISYGYDTSMKISTYSQTMIHQHLQH